MGNTDGSAFRRMLRKLTSDVEELDAENLSGDADRSGAQRAAECACGQEVTVLGRLRSVEYGPQDAAATLEAGDRTGPDHAGTRADRGPGGQEGALQPVLRDLPGDVTPEPPATTEPS